MKPTEEKIQSNTSDLPVYLFMYILRNLQPCGLSRYHYPYILPEAGLFVLK